MLEILTDAQAVALIGMAGGVVLGLAARLGRFCTLGAIEDLLYSSDDRRMRMWALAIGAAIFGTHLAMGVGWVDTNDTAYLQQKWNPAATILGGLMFGYGMALAGNCGYGALARLGGGDLRSLMIVLVMGLSAAVVMSGPLAYARIWLFPVDPTDTPQGFGTMLHSLFGVSPVVLGLVAGVALIALGLANARMRRSPSHILWGLVVGIAIASGWIGTTWIAEHGFDGESVRTHTFAAPLGETFFYMMTASGTPVTFGVGSVVGVVIGAIMGSWSKGHFRWEACEDPRELKRQILGAALMGPGAILAMGCSVGQGIAAFSVLAYSAPVAFAAILAGAAIGLRQLITGFSTA
jgi:uncharacterized membrane protein YedE/YeeE